MLHIHEPATPSLSLLACWAATGPIVATFHTSNLRSRAMLAASPLLEPALEKIGARVAVSEDARRTVVEHLGGDAVLIPNGVFVDRFARRGAASRPGRGRRGRSASSGGSTRSARGCRRCSPRWSELVASRPGVRLLVAGRGDVEEADEDLPPAVREAVTFLGVVCEADKARLLRSVDVYVAPNLGGESFGIILVEAMSAGAPVLASDLDAFRRVLDDGRVGELFPTGDVTRWRTRSVGCWTTPTGATSCGPTRRRGCAASTGRRWLTSCWRSTRPSRPAAGRSGRPTSGRGATAGGGSWSRRAVSAAAPSDLRRSLWIRSPPCHGAPILRPRKSARRLSVDHGYLHPRAC